MLILQSLVLNIQQWVLNKEEVKQTTTKHNVKEQNI